MKINLINRLLGSSKTLLFEASKLKQKMLKAQFPEIEKYFDLPKLTIAQIEYLQRFSSLSNLHNLYSRSQFSISLLVVFISINLVLNELL